MRTEKAVKQKLPLRPPAQNTFPFLYLPRELRDTIYGHSISAGNLEILRINRLVNAEASELLPKHAVLRVNLGFQGRTNWIQSGSGSLPSIQHVEFRLHTSSYAIPFGLEALADFSDHQTIRDSCLVTLNYGHEGTAAPHSIRYQALFNQLARLRGFRTLVVRIMVEKYDAKDFEGLLTEEQFRDVFRYETRLIPHHEESYEKVRDFLEVSLGPAKFDSSVDGHCLEFHPLEHVPEGWKTGHETAGFEDGD